MAEVSGLVENIQEVCALIRADATELAALSLADSPRKQANEVCLFRFCSPSLSAMTLLYTLLTHRIEPRLSLTGNLHHFCDSSEQILCEKCSTLNFSQIATN